MSINFLIQNTEIEDLDGVIDCTLELLSESCSQIIPTLSEAKSAFQICIFESLKETIEDFFEDSGIDVEINSVEDITPEIQEITGVRIPHISDFLAEKIFFEKRIVFEKDNGVVVNHPQIPVVGGRSYQNHNPLIHKQP